MYNRGNRDHWAKKTQEKNKWIIAVAQAVIGQLPPSPLVKYRLDLTRYSSREPDFDGICSGFKAIVDGLRHARIIADDKISNSGQWGCHWFKVKKGEGHVEIEVSG